VFVMYFARIVLTCRYKSTSSLTCQ